MVSNCVRCGCSGVFIDEVACSIAESMNGCLAFPCSKYALDFMGWQVCYCQTERRKLEVNSGLPFLAAHLSPIDKGDYSCRFSRRGLGFYLALAARISASQ